MDNILKRQTGVRGRYKFVKGRSETSTYESGWVDNLVTDLGLNLIADNEFYMATCHVGAGSAIPSVTDVALVSLIASTTTIQSEAQSAAPVEPYYCRVVRRFRFGQGVAAGNISEVGVGVSASQLFSRALVLDDMGNPTSIQVLPDEWLDVYYELTLEIDTSDVVGQITLGGNIGGTYDFIFRPAMVSDLKSAATATSSSGWGFSLASGAGASNTMSNRLTNWGSPGSAAGAFTGDIGPVTGSPSGTQIGGSGTGNRPGYLVLPYVQDSHEIVVRRTAGLTQNNGSIRSIGFSVGIMHHQIQFDPPIPKTSNDVLVLDIAHRWGRA